MNRTLTHRARRARSVTTWWAGVARVLAEDVEHVAEVEAHGADVQLDASVGRWLRSKRHRLEHQPAQRPTPTQV